MAKLRIVDSNPAHIHQELVRAGILMPHTPTKNKTTTKKSPAVTIALFLLVLAAITVIIASFSALLYVAFAAVILAAGAVTFAVLSLRE